MDLFESIAPPQLRLQYIAQLLDRIDNDANPSIPMVRRVQGLIMEFGG